MGCRACAVLVGLLLGVAIFPTSAALGDEGLVLSPNQGFVGDGVKAEASVAKCAVFVVRWKGDVIGTDDGSDGRGTVYFRVPDSPGTTQPVEASCKASAGGPERLVGQASFDVLEVSGSTTTTIVSPTSTVPGTTTRPGSPTTSRGPTPSTRKPPTTVASTSTSRVPGTTRPPTTTTPASRPTTVGPTPSTTRPVPQDVSECERQARDAESRLVYQPNRQMTVGIPYDVVVQVALDSSDVSVVTTPGSAPTTIVRLRSARCTIEAELTGAGSDFQVTPPGPLAQSFIASRVLTWRWQVAPLRTGAELKLVLRLQPTVIEDGKPPRPGSGEVHEALIQVAAQPQSLISKVGDRANGVVGNDLVKLLLIPSGGGLLTLWAGHRYRRRTKEGAGQA